MDFVCGKFERTLSGKLFVWCFQSKRGRKILCFHVGDVFCLITMVLSALIYLVFLKLSCWKPRIQNAVFSRRLQDVFPQICLQLNGKQKGSWLTKAQKHQFAFTTPHVLFSSDRSSYSELSDRSDTSDTEIKCVTIVTLCQMAEREKLNKKWHVVA